MLQISAAVILYTYFPCLFIKWCKPGVAREIYVYNEYTYVCEKLIRPELPRLKMQDRKCYEWMQTALSLALCYLRPYHMKLHKNILW